MSIDLGGQFGVYVACNCTEKNNFLNIKKYLIEQNLIFLVQEIFT